MTAPDRPGSGAGSADPALPVDEKQWFTTAEVAAAAGVSATEVRRFWRALGFPDVGEEAGYTESDVAAMVALKAALDRAGVDTGTGIRLARAVGQNVARMSDWQVAAVASRLEADGDLEPARRSAETLELTDRIAPALEGVLVYAWRRHLVAAIARLDGAESGEEEKAVSVTVGFADLVSFSALSNELDSARLGELVEIFESRCADVVAAHDGRMIKTLGDSVLFVAGDADRAMDIALGLVDVIGHDPRLPDVSLGLATGTVVTRLGDVFGPPVNLAARLTSLARRNRILVDSATVDQLSDGRYELLRLTARPLRGFGLVEPVAVRLR